MMILDGGMGQELVKRSGEAPSPLWATRVMLDHPELVRAIHDDYFAAGAEIATTNTYAIHHDRLIHAELDDQFETLHQRACALACAARDARGSGLIAGSLGPLGWSYRPDQVPPVYKAAALYREIVAIHDAYVDVHLIETMSGLIQAEGALAGCDQAQKPVWLAGSVDDFDGSKLRSGEPLAELVPMAKTYGAKTLFINCARPEAVTQALETIQDCGLTLGAYANGFTYINAAFKSNTATVDELQQRDDLDPAAYLEFAKRWAELGASIIGGCCEVGPDHIATLSEHFRAAP